MGEQLYTGLWSKILHEKKIIQTITNDNCLFECDLKNYNFDNYGDRNKYSFKIEFSNGRCVKITNSAVARDLCEIVLRDAKTVLRDKYVILRMGKNFNFSLECVKLPQNEEEEEQKKEEINHSNISPKERNLLIAQGFVGFKSMKYLMDGGIKDVPTQMGVYVVLREKESKPKFLINGSGGTYKGKAADVPVEVLNEKWVSGAHVVYIGKAGVAGNQGKAGEDTTLKDRLSQYIRFGQGKTGHWGGRYIWQLEDSKDLIVCWKILTEANPKDVETKMIAEFKNAHSGKRPFANLQD